MSDTILMASSNLQQLHPSAENARTFKSTLNWSPEELDAAGALLQLSQGCALSSELNSTTKADRDDDELEYESSVGKKRKASYHTEPSLKRSRFDYAVESESDGGDKSGFDDSSALWTEKEENVQMVHRGAKGIEGFIDHV